MNRDRRIACWSNLLLSVSIWFLLSPVVSSQIPLGSKLTVEDNNYWVSSNGDYAIGFLNFSGEYIFGVRFNSIYIPSSEQAAIWTAGSNDKVSSKAYFELSSSGEMTLFDSANGIVVWQSKTGNASVESAVLRDDGNFVLLNTNKSVVWQSFENPFDTLLSGQNLSVGKSLRASSRGSLTSFYSLFMTVSGEMQLRWDSSVIYWTVGGPSQSAVRAILGLDGILRLLDQRSKSVWSVYGEDHNDSDVRFRFLRLDSDGNLRIYSWETNATSWRIAWQAIINQCDVFATCGTHGICFFNASDSYVCQCPFRSRDSNSECLIPYKPSCESGSSMIRYDHMSMYGIYPPNKTVVQTSLQQCRNLCQKDPSCHAATFINNGTAQCHMLKSQYVGGQSDPSLGSVTFVKTCSDPIAVLPAPVPAPRKLSQKICVACLLKVAAASLVVFVMLQCAIGVYLFRRRKRMMQKSASAHTVPNATGCIMFSYSEIKDLTDNFKQQIGQNVFKGVFPDNRLVAVKDLNASIEERKFRSAVLKIGSIYHKNLLRLDGYCCESGRRLLVYELAKYGSVDKFLEEPRMCKRLTWRKRIDICLSVARAISYLHTGCREFVSHGNLKCENVVLDDELEAKVSEFGLRTIQAEASSSGGLAETDVRDFGKMMVVLITGRQDADDACYWAYENWVKAEREMVMDQRIEGGVDLEELERALRITFWCLQDDERMRPSMGEVVKVLEGTLSVDPPPPPFAHSQQRPPIEETPSESPAESYSEQ